MATVLIAPAAHLGSMKERDEFQDAVAFADTDALRALEAITRQRPDVVALESAFAATSRGAALINRIKADPSLGTCEIRIVSPVSEKPEAPPATAPPSAAAEIFATGPPAPQEPIPGPPPAGQPAPRFEIVDGVELLVDGNPGTLIDLSRSGAQVACGGSLKPTQRVRLTLPSVLQPIRVVGVVMWAVFEMPASGPRYRAGIAFFDPDTAGLERFIDANKK